MSRMYRWAGRLWAAPWTLVAAGLVPVVLITGGAVRIDRGLLELHGGILGWFLTRALPGRSFAAMTLGHAILAVDRERLEASREHELVHVAQYERWGLFFPLIYGGASLIAWIRGGDYYWDNHFEREARGCGGP